MVMYDKEYPKKKIEFKPGIKWNYNINIEKKKGWKKKFWRFKGQLLKPRNYKKTAFREINLNGQ